MVPPHPYYACMQQVFVLSVRRMAFVCIAQNTYNADLLAGSNVEKYVYFKRSLEQGRKEVRRKDGWDDRHKSIRTSSVLGYLFTDYWNNHRRLFIERLIYGQKGEGLLCNDTMALELPKGNSSEPIIAGFLPHACLFTRAFKNSCCCFNGSAAFLCIIDRDFKLMLVLIDVDFKGFF